METVPRNVLLKAVKLIKQWHDMPSNVCKDSTFKIYYELAPEMKMIRDTLGDYDLMKHEVIEATSEAVKVAKNNRVKARVIKSVCEHDWKAVEPNGSSTTFICCKCGLED